MGHQVALSKTELKSLIVDAAAGDQAKLERIVTTFLSPDEQLLWCGVTAKLGFITTYDFAFVTDRRVGDIEITPLTGNLHVESCYLHHIDACVIQQPAFPIWMWILQGSMFVLAPLLVRLGFIVFFTMVWTLELDFVYGLLPWFYVRWLLMLGALPLTYFIINPGIRRLYLRFKKSGIWLKLRGSRSGIRIFADRQKFGMLGSLLRVITEQKRLLDREAF